MGRPTTTHGMFAIMARMHSGRLTRRERRTLARILSDTYRLLSEDGRSVTRGDIQRDVTRLFCSNAEAWMDLRAPASDAPAQTL